MYTTTNFKCPHCKKPINPAEHMGRSGGIQKSEAKTKAARENGKLGGRPKRIRPTGDGA